MYLFKTKQYNSLFSKDNNSAFKRLVKPLAITVPPIRYLTAGGGVGASSVPNCLDLSNVVTKHVLTFISSIISSVKS
ncbi:hypothetical protein V1477_006996 [Vespula maculifrons]|uniref:Uncharacterized protein n=1 Tax=Vespula maculifrons TaxID=7453 RepID=A0ABD2CHU4_VESMC